MKGNGNGRTDVWEPLQGGSATPLRSPDDPPVIAALEEYASALQAGQAPDRDAFQAGHPEIAPVLAECLDGLELMRGAVGASPAAALAAASAGSGVEPGTSLGDFHIVREIGRGGMGVVYEAEQLSLRRRVALKVLPCAAALDPKQLQRFKNESQAAAQRHHTHIVPVYAVGCEGSVHYYAMQFIEGQSLAALIHEMRQSAGLEVQLIEPATGRQVATLPNPESRWVNCLAFSHDGSRLAVSTSPTGPGEEGELGLFDLRVVRRQLAEMGLDWDLPPYPASSPWQEGSAQPLQVDLNLGVLKGK